MYNFYQDTDYTTFVANMNWQNCVRSGIRTHAHIRGPENSLMRHEKGINLESGALDHSAILTYDKYRKIIETLIVQHNKVWATGFRNHQAFGYHAWLRSPRKVGHGNPFESGQISRQVKSPGL